MIASVLPLFALLQATEPAPTAVEPTPTEPALAATAAPTAEEPQAHLFGLGAAAGMMVNNYGAAAFVRVSGEVTLLNRPFNDFVAFVQVGSAVGVVLPADGYIREHYQHVALAGFGYRSNHPLISWGFQLGLGAVWYRAAFFPGTYLFDSWVTTYTEGRAQFGFKLAPNFRAGAYVGYGSLLWYPGPSSHQGAWFVGGVLFGLYADWR